MKLLLDTSLAQKYRSKSQIARVLTESWAAENMFCPRCGNPNITHFDNNRPVADFFCPLCGNEFELKSKSGNLGQKVNDGAYETMIQRIKSNQNPDFLLMNYSLKELKVNNVILIPKHFFIPDIIEKRKPLSESARRAGWVGCNILIEQIPIQGRVPIIEDGIVSDITEVVRKTNKASALEVKDIKARGWLLDILSCVNKLSSNEFVLNEMYSFEHILAAKHTENHNVRPKIRQQLQMLRDKGFIEFLGNGRYRKVVL